MNKIYKFLVVSTMFLSLAVANSVSAADTFSASLKYGDKGPEVIKLQNFLVGQGLLAANLVTGNFLTLTQKAVIAFQKSNGIDPIGIFGPLTRTVANSKLGVAVATNKPSIAAVSVSANANTASVIASNARKITWQTSSYPSNVGVDINILKKTSSNPAAYTLVEKIAKDTPNDGSENWVPKSNQTGADIYVEITCSTSHNFTEGCSSAGAPVKAF